jgi:hypothetical protein
MGSANTFTNRIINTVKKLPVKKNIRLWCDCSDYTGVSDLLDVIVDPLYT